MDVLERLKALKEHYGWSDYKVAQKAGLSQGTVSNIFKRNTVPSFTTLEAICSGFGITLAQFFADGETVELTEDMRELFDGWAILPPDKKELVIKLIRALNN